MSTTPLMHPRSWNHPLSTAGRFVSARVLSRMALLQERGDVPGWVLVAVMTAGLVTAIWLIADDRLTGVLDGAITSVATP